MKRIDLGGIWRMTGNGYDCEGIVPGSVYSFLLDAGLMEDPFYRDNEWKALALMEYSYTFSRSFAFGGEQGRVKLCCDGLDTLCSVELNGIHIAATQNMHRRYEFDITEHLLSGENHLSLRFDSPTRYVRELDRQEHLPSSREPYQGFPYLRKAHCMFGWDWGPMLPDAGIWRNIYLLVEDSPRITDCHILQRHENGRVFITPKVAVSAPCALSAELITPEGTVTPIPCNKETEVTDPRLWWPNGMGSQPLYTVTVQAVENGKVVDTVSKRIGLRTLRLIRKRDRYGESFCHEINGVKFFAMGADYIPEDNILSRITPERTRWLLTQAKSCSFNTIRVWGGGIYPDDAFFDLCDELGIVVFLDMMVACCLLPDSQEIRDEIAAEVRDNLLRIRHHASIALVCGNNEAEHMFSGDSPAAHLRESYLDLFEDTLPRIISEVCPGFDYTPSSPTTCGHFIDPYNENYGDNHYWNVWHGGVPYTDYRKHYFRYLSEFGFQSFPCEKTVESFTAPEDRNIFSRIMERHQRNAGANGKILNYLSQTFLYPTDFSTLLYASQLLQAIAIQYGVEHLRRNRGRCMGALYWQFNDIWPVASWASIDYFGRYKALQYAAKRFFAPVMISCEEVGETATRPDVNMQPEIGYETTAALSIHNDSMTEIRGTVRWWMCSADSTVLESGSEEVAVPALSVVTLEKMDFRQTDPRRNHLSYALEMDGQEVSRGAVLFTMPKHYLYGDPQLTCRVQGDEITVYAENFAHFVQIDSPDSDFILSDNFFHMEKGSRTVKILEGTPKTVRLRSVWDIR